MNEGSIRLTRQVATRKLSMRRKKEFQSAEGLRGAVGVTCSPSPNSYASPAAAEPAVSNTRSEKNLRPKLIQPRN
jgi:hypothetical protein